MPNAPRHTRPLPGDATSSLASMLRVNHAGEYGAQRIYAGQLAVLGASPIGKELRHMAAQEAVHLATFNRVLPAQRVRPSALLPLWHIAGFALGAGTALMGQRAAMACTVAVESVITEHYDAQLAQPEVIGHELKQTIQQFRDEEMEHHDLGLAHDAENLPGYTLLNSVITAGCRAAIWLTSRM